MNIGQSAYFLVVIYSTYDIGIVPWLRSPSLLHLQLDHSKESLELMASQQLAAIELH